jgi:hypothetical protein
MLFRSPRDRRGRCSSVCGYVATGTFLPYCRYRHTRRDRSSAERLSTPTGIARMPGDEPGSPGRTVAGQQFNLVHWTDMPLGGHFAAIEVPDLLAADLKTFAGLLTL